MHVIDVEAGGIVDASCPVATPRRSGIPRCASSCAVTEPTFPNPCTATVVPFTFMPRCASASLVTNMQPRPVASRRPSDPPISTGFPVTTDVVV